MNALKLVAIGAVVCLLAGGARAEEKVDYAKLIVGKWEVSKADEGTVPIGAVVEFTKDGKMEATHKKDGTDTTVKGTYKIEGNKFTMTMTANDKEVSRTITINKISDTEMETENPEGKKVTLTRKK
jgi:uncharacterized protein (TIGR03066 family)